MEKDMKKDVKDIIQKEEIYLNNLLTQEDLLSFKGMVDELRDTWTKKQMFRTETEARFSVLQDNRYPTKAAKYWQCVREQSSKHRMREIKMWSKLKGEFNDGSFNDKDVNQHQLESYGLQYHEKAKSLNANSSEAEIFNVMGQLNSLQRIKKSGELESSYTETEKLTQHGKPKV
jgi:hypothetical protein